MFRDSFLLFSSEIRSFFRDKASLLIIIIMPMVIMPVLIVGLYSSQRNMQIAANTRQYFLQIENADNANEFLGLLKGKLNFTQTNRDNKDVFVLHFSQPGIGAELKADIFYSSTTPGASHVIDVLRATISEYRMARIRKFLTDKSLPIEVTTNIDIEAHDRTLEHALGASSIGGMIPYLLIIYIFSGVLMVGLAATTGEKEKGSFSLLLLTPADRGAIAFGKILYIMVTGIMNALSSALGLLLSGVLLLFLGLADPSTISSGAMAGIGSASVSSFMSIFSPFSFVLFFLNLVVIAALFSSLIVIIGLRCKTVKEASGYTMPLFLIVLIAVIPTISRQGTVDTREYFIPILNTAHCLKNILGGTLSVKNQILCFISNIIVIGIAVWLTRRIFSSEKILYTA